MKVVAGITYEEICECLSDFGFVELRSDGSGVNAYKENDSIGKSLNTIFSEMGWVCETNNGDWQLGGAGWVSCRVDQVLICLDYNQVVELNK